MSSFELRHRRLWWVLAWGLVGLILYLSLTPSPPQVTGISDKLQHAFAYALLMSWFAQLSPRHLKLAIWLVVMGVGVEFVQGWSGLRHYEVLDMAANASGVLIGWLLVQARFVYLNWLDELLPGKP